MAALLAVALSFAAVLSVASMVPMADAAAGVSSARRHEANAHLHRWHQQQSFQQQQQQQQWLGQVRRPMYDADDPSRQKRQLFRKNVNREPGIVSLTFSLIGGTISDARQAYRNVTGIVRDTISEVAKIQEPSTSTSAAPSGGDQTMAAGNSMENEIGGSGAMSNTSTAPAVDQKVAGQALGKLLGRNYRGLRRLFNSELQSALKNSPGNVRDFAVELAGSIGQSLRPSNLFTRGPVNGGAQSTTSTKR